MKEAKSKARIAIEAARPRGHAIVTDQATTRYGRVLDKFVDPDNHDRWGKGGGSRHADNVKSLLWNHVRPQLAHRSCGSLTPTDFRSILQSMRREGYSGSTIQNVGSAMRATVSFMMHERYIEQGYDPMLGVSYQAKGAQDAWVPSDDRPSIEDKDALACAMAAIGGQRWWLATQLAALAGPRWGELIYLKPEHVSLSTNEILVEYQWNEQARKQPDGLSALGQPGGPFVKTRPKNGKERVITYPAWMNEHLERLFSQVAVEMTATYPWSGRRKNPLGLLFTTPTGTIPRRSSWNRQVITPARLAAGWPHTLATKSRTVKGKPEMAEVAEFRWTWHSLRHLFCSLTISSGPFGYNLEPAEGAKLAGHSIQVFLQKYVQPPAGFTKRTAEVMARQAAPTVQAPNVAS